MAKIRDYLLSHSHPVGRNKARVFNALGFDRRRWQQLRLALKEMARQGAVSEVSETPHGRKFVVGGMLHGPNGRSLGVVTIWMLLQGQHFPRLITVYPEKD